MELTFQELQKEVAFHVFGDPTMTNMSTGFLDRIKTYLNVALSNAIADMPIKGVHRDGTITLVTAQSTYDLTATRVQRIVMGTLYYSEQPELPLRFIREPEFITAGLYADTTTGPPELLTDFRYDSTSKQYEVRVWPTPSAAENGNTINFQYEQYPAEMSANGDVPPLPEPLQLGLIHGAIVLGFAGYINDPKVLEVHLSAWRDYMRRLARHKEFTTAKRREFKGPAKRRPYFGNIQL